MPELLIAISADGAASADVHLYTLRRWLVEGLVPVVSVAGQNLVRSIDCGLSLRQAAAELGVPVDTVVSLLRAGDLKPMSALQGDTRLRRADVEKFCRQLQAVPMTDELREEIWPSVETFEGHEISDHPAIGWGDEMAALERRQAARDAQVEAEFQQYLRKHFPQHKLTDVGEGVQEFDPNGSLSPEQEADQRHAWFKRRHAEAEAERDERFARRMLG